MKGKAVVGFVLVVLFLMSLFPLSTLFGATDSHGTPGLLRPQSTVDPTDWWPMFHHDSNHTGYSTSTGPSTNNILWTYHTGSGVDSPSVVGGFVYVGSYDGQVYCLNAITGALVWNCTIGAEVESSPAVVGGLVYMGSGFPNDSVCCLNAATGALVWNYTTGSALDSSPAIVSGFVYVGSDDWNVYCLNATSGAFVWSYTTGYVWISSPAVAGGLVYVGSYDCSTYCLNAATGAPLWSYETSGGWSSPAVVNGVDYVESEDGNIYAFGPSSADHDVSIEGVIASKSVVGSGYSMSINFTAADLGSYTETVNTTAYANATIIGSENVTLPASNSTTVTFTWNTTGFDYGNYTLSASALLVPGETNTGNNTMTSGTVYVGIPGDINGDGTVDIYDAILLAGAFNSQPSSPNWNPNADINGDGIVDIYDALILSAHFNQSIL